MLKNMSIKSKLMVAFTIVAFIPAIVGWLANHYSAEVINEYRSIAKANVPNLEEFVIMNRLQVQVILPVAHMVGSNSTAAEAEEAKREVDRHVAAFNESVKKYLAVPFAEGEEAAWNQFRDDCWKPFLDMTYEMIRLSGTGKKEDFARRDAMWSNEYKKLREARIEQFNKVMEFQIIDTHRKSDEGDRIFARMGTTMLLTIVFGFLTCMCLGMMISSYLVKQIQAVILALREDSTGVSAASTQLAASANSLSQAATQQAASLQQTAASIEELTSMVAKNTENSQRSADSSSDSRSRAGEGKAAVEQVINSMGAIQTSSQAIADQVNASNEQLNEIIAIIRSIGDKTKVINDIVFQTKLLSFNASVEAARAGEQGKGFAVVAEEVGNLASMSGSSAKDISDLLNVSIEKVENIVSLSKSQVESLVKEGNFKVDQGIQVAKNCANILDQIVNNVSDSSVMASEIATASKEQSRGIEEMNKAMAELSQVTHHNATATDQTSQAANSLSGRAISLNDTVRTLSGIIYGDKAAA